MIRLRICDVVAHVKPPGQVADELHDCGLYLIHNARNHVQYVGQSADPWRRVRMHMLWGNQAIDHCYNESPDQQAWDVTFLRPSEVFDWFAQAWRTISNIDQPLWARLAAEQLLIGLHAPSLNGAGAWALITPPEIAWPDVPHDEEVRRAMLEVTE